MSIVSLGRFERPAETPPAVYARELLAEIPDVAAQEITVVDSPQYHAPLSIVLQGEMLAERGATSVNLGPIAVADLFGVYVAAVCNDKVRSRFPQKVVDGAVQKLSDDVAVFEIVTTPRTISAMLANPELLVHRLGNGQTSGSHNTDEQVASSSSSGAAGGETHAAQLSTEHIEDDAIKYDPMADNDDSEIIDEATLDAIIESGMAEAWEHVRRIEQSRADERQTQLDMLASRRLIEVVTDRQQRQPRHLTVRERAFIADAVGTFDPLAEQRRLAGELLGGVSLVAPAFEVSDLARVEGLSSPGARTAILAGRISVRASQAWSRLRQAITSSSHPDTMAY